MSEDRSRLHIGEVAKLTGLNPKTVRYYEEIGLIPAPRRSETVAGNGYRLYSRRDVARLQMVKRVRHLGLPLKEVRKLVRTAEKGCCPTVGPRLSKLLKTQISEIDQKIGELTELRMVLTGLSRPSSPKGKGTLKSRECSSPGCLCGSKGAPSQSRWQPVHFKGPKSERGASSRCCEPNCSPRSCPPR